MCKAAAAGSNVDFQGSEQQDAREYFQHVAERVSRAMHALKSDDPMQWFQFVTEERIECVASGKVKYTKASSNVLQLNIPLDDAESSKVLAKRTKVASSDSNSRKSDNDDERVRVPFSDCLEATLGAPEIMDGYLSSATGKRGQASRRSLMLTFPKYLFVQLNRYIVGPDWRPVKIDSFVPVPECIDITHLRAPGGLQDGESPLPDEAEAAPEAQPQPDEMIVAQLTSMGFHVNGCRRAAVATGNSGVEAAMEWVFAHSSDPDFELPLDAQPKAQPSVSAERA